MRNATRSLAFLLFSIVYLYTGNALGSTDLALEATMLRSRDGRYAVTYYRSPDLIAVKQEHEDKSSEIAGVIGARAANFTPVDGELLGYNILRYSGTIPLGDTLRELKVAAGVASDTVAHVFYTSRTDFTPFIPTGRIHLKFQEGTDPAVCSAVLAAHQLAIAKVLGPLEFYVKVAASVIDPIFVSSQLQDLVQVEHAVPNCITYAQTTSFVLPTDRLMKDQWHLRNVGTCRGTLVGLKRGADARVVDAWEAMDNLGSSEIKIAVIDDGFDLGHPDLGGADPSKIVFPRDFKRGDHNPVYDKGDWHGTATAGVATGIDNGGDIIGVAPKAKLMPIRWSQVLDEDSIEDWFAWAMDNGADIISCSWKAKAKIYSLNPMPRQFLANVARDGRGGKGCVIVFAAGNENCSINDEPSGSLNGFAIHPDVIAVSASTSMDVRADYSSFGKEISVCAPSSGVGGMGILTCDVRGAAGYNKKGDYTEEFGGTSSSTPLVAGVAALILSINPELTSAQVKNILQQTARKIDVEGGGYDALGHSIYYGYGCVDAHAAVLKAMETLVPLAAVAEATKPKSVDNKRAREDDDTGSGEDGDEVDDRK